MTKKIENICVSQNTPIIDVMKILDASYAKTALVLNDNGQLMGTVTDGDVRRGIINKHNITDSVSLIMNSKPIVGQYIKNKIDFSDLKDLMLKFKINAIPLLDADKKIVELVTSDQILHDNLKQNTVVIMAGGLGTRLGDLTADCPKPMLKIGDKPMLHIIIENLKEYGFRSFYLSVNYKAEMIEDYFKDGSAFGVNIKYIKEKEKMGTAGSLSLLPELNTLPVIVMNGDVLTKVNFSQLLENHNKKDNIASMCVRKFDFQVPFGVIETEGEMIKNIEEKPMQSFFVNAGIYVINSDMIKSIPKSGYYDMPSFFNDLIKTGKSAAVFPIHEYWLDVGRKDDFERAQFEFLKVF